MDYQEDRTLKNKMISFSMGKKGNLILLFPHTLQTFTQTSLSFLIKISLLVWHECHYKLMSLNNNCPPSLLRIQYPQDQTSEVLGQESSQE